MKKTMIAFAVLFAFAATAAHAESVKGKASAEAYGGFGFTYAGGSIPSGASVETSTAYNVGILGSYGFADTVSFIGGFEYSSKPLVVKYEGGEKDTFQLKYANILAGVRFFITDGFYGEGGFFYGIKAGDQKAKWEADGDSGTVNISDIDSAKVNNDFGLFLGLGYIFAINNNVAIDLGLRVEGGLVKTYEYEDTKIQTRDIMLNLGAQYTF